jgi:hypothetical protein
MFAISSGRLGQVQILAAIVFLFLIPTTVIIAQNATNSSNTSFDTFVENLSLEGNLIAPANTSNVTEQSQEERPPENQTSETTNSSGDAVDEEIPPNQTLNETVQNETLNQTLPEKNQTLNETDQNLNETLPETLPENITSPQNETEPQNETLNETASPPLIPPSNLPSLAVSIQGPDRITRGEDITFSVDITNEGNGTAFGVRGYWQLPEGLDVPARFFDCPDLGPGESCTQEITIPTTPSTSSGISEITVKVGYDG